VITYAELEQEEYVNLLINLISSAEGHIATATDIGDNRATIGYGYTFNRSNNLALWQAAGITLTPEEEEQLEAIDAAADDQKTALALQFTRSISKDEAKDLLRQTYGEYEAPALALDMPFSHERAAFVSLAYNRGVVNLERRMQGFYDAVRDGNRAEAWFQMRYMSWGSATRFEAGLRARRLVESQVFSLYNSLTITAEEAQQVYTMLHKNRQEILKVEARWGLYPDGTPGTRNLYDEVNADPRWNAFSVATLTDSLITARDAFVPWVNTLLPATVTPLVADDWNSAAIYFNTANPRLDARGDDGKGSVSGPRLDHNLLVGQEAADVLFGGTGADTLIGRGGEDHLEGGAGDDLLIGGVGKDVYVWNTGDGNDTIIDGDGGVLRINGTDFSFAGGTMVRDGSQNAWVDSTGNVRITHNSPWRIELPDGSVIELGATFNPLDWNIQLVDAQEDPSTGLEIRGDKVIIDFDPEEPGVQPAFDSLNNRITTSETAPVRDLLHGSAGNDLIVGLALGDILKGNEGDDLIFANAEVDVATAIADWATGAGATPGYLSMSGAANNDILFGNGGNDTLVGTAGDDVLAGGAGNDLLVGGQGDDYLDGDGNLTVTETDWNFNWTFTEFEHPVAGLAYALTGDQSSWVVTPPIIGADTIHAGSGDDVADGGYGNDTLYGEDGNDRLLGNGGADTIIGGEGDDELRGDQVFGNFPGTSDNPADDGDDFLDGGNGNDTLIGEGGSDVLIGGAGNDWLAGDRSGAAGHDPDALHAGNDYLDGGAGNDELIGHGGNDTLIGGIGDDGLQGDYWETPDNKHGDDHLDGGAGNDNLWGYGGADVLLGGDGDDELVGEQASTAEGAHGADHLDGGAGNDTLFGGGNDDLLLGGDGDDELQGEGTNFSEEVAGDDILDGGGGHDILVGGSKNDSLHGGEGNDQLFGDSADSTSDATGDDHLDGGDGNDTLVGEGGADTLIGGAGNDTLAGEAADTAVTLHAADFLDGGAGNDVLIGEGGADTLIGGDGADQLHGESATTAASVSGNDFLDGGAGNDILLGWAGNDTLLGGAGADTLSGDASGLSAALHGNDVLSGGAGNDGLAGNGGNDELNGDEGGDQLFGGDGDDLLAGGSGNDYIEGGAGNDTLDGGADYDILDGGTGDDTYRLGPGTRYDEVIDSGGNDRIQLAAGILPTDVTLVRTSTARILGPGAPTADSLVVVLNSTGEQILIRDYFASGNANAIEEIRFENGTAWNAATIASLLIDQSGTANSQTAPPAGGNFQVDHHADTVDAPAGGGVDHISSSVSHTLSANVENLTLAGVLALAGNGNSLANVLTGNTADNSLYGGGGADTLIGGQGNDTYYVDGALFEASDDVVVENAGEGYDTVYGSAWDVTLSANVERFILNNPINPGSTGTRSYVGNALDNYIDVSGTWFGNGHTLVVDGGAGADVMVGSTGRQVYDVDDLGDVVLELDAGTNVVEGASGRDLVSSSVDFILPDLIEDLSLSGTHAIRGVGNNFGNHFESLTNTAANVLEGGLGDDVYLIGANDIIVEYAGEGIDTVQASFTYTLAGGVENLLLYGFGAASGTGNALNNRLTAWDNSSPNTLSGGNGDDLYELGAGDIALENAGEGTDTVIVQMSYVLGDHIENATGLGGVSLTGNALANVLTAGGHGAALHGNAGDDVLIGTFGNQTLSGGSGADIYRFASGFGTDVVQDTNTGETPDAAVDTIEFAAGIQASNLFYTRGSNVADLIIRRQGSSDRITIVNFYADGAAQDRIEQVRFADGTVLTAAQIAQSFVFTGTEGADTLNAPATSGELYGLGGADTLNGSAENDLLDGGSGADTMTGGAGHDYYRVDDAGDVVIENAGGGTDTVESAISHVLGDNVENLTLTGSANLNGTGNAEDNVMRGNAGSNVLDGGAGFDHLHGGAGDDTYYVDDLDTIHENAGEGLDTVYASGSFGMGEHTENGFLLGTDDISIGGNSANNVLTGNSGANGLFGGAGQDTLIGGLGDDWYGVDDAGDVIVELAGEGNDGVEASISYVLGNHLENLSLAYGLGLSINATGNALDNYLVGNEADNVLTGAGGVDTMEGLEGNDTYVVDSASEASLIFEEVGFGTDTVRSSVAWTLGANFENLELTGSSNINGTGNSANNVMTGNSGSNTLSGGSGHDTLDGGGAGTDVLTGGQGNDIFVVNHATVTTTESSGQGTDTVQSSITWTLASNIENLVLTGTGNINGTGNTGVNNITGNSGNNVLNGGTGVDVMAGGAGDDTYQLDSASETVTELAGEGTDTVQIGATYTLGANVENLLLTGTSGFTGTGNALDNVLTGNGGANTLNGGDGNDRLDGAAGNDTLAGGAGNDTYVFGTGDTINESAGAGTDTVESATAIAALQTNVEILFLTGSSNINGTGNALDNLLRGNGGTNTLAGGTGVDILEGGLGTDTLTDSGGNTMMNGGGGADTLTGGAANDLLIGGTGNDAITTGQGADIIVFNRGDGQDTVAASTVRDNTVSLGNGILYADLLFQKSGNNLILMTGAGDQITFTNYYASSSNRSVDRLQVIIEGTSDYDSGSADATRNQFIQTFDFEGLVAAFDAARAANPSLTTWALTNALTTEHLSGSDTAALGGDLAYRYGRYNTLGDVSFLPAVGILAAAGFGASSQNLQALSSLQDATARLS
jgi:trimeric autotransporter adhesin